MGTVCDVIMKTVKELDFVIFVIHALAEAWQRPPSDVYARLVSSGVLTRYIIPCYDVLHTLGRQYLVEDITACVREWEGVA